jgi:DNA-directed RNA polymerase specialized sigma24 family protein
MTRLQMLAWVQAAVANRVGVGTVVRFLYSKGTTPRKIQERTEEAMQEAYCKILARDPADFADDKHLASSFCQAAIHAAIAAWRRRRRERQFAEGQEDDLLARGSQGYRLQAVQLLRLYRLMLSTDERRLLEMKYDEGLTLEEMARELGLSLTNAWGRLQAILERLRRAILEEAGCPDEPAL